MEMTGAGRKGSIIPGSRVGKLTVKEPTDKRKNGYYVWKCRCDCGRETELDTRRLQRGLIRDCGCETKINPRIRDLRGQRYGKLVCLSPTEEKDRQGNTIWLCRCDCGDTCRVSAHLLLSGYRKSCGCIRRAGIRDYVGMRFGRLTVLAYAGKKDGMHHWRCRCDCGSETVVGQTRLQSGKTKSCGCLKQEQILINAKYSAGSSVALIEWYKTHLNPKNTSGCTGVYFNKKLKKWSASVIFKNQTYALGYFDTLGEAEAARKKGEKVYDDFLNRYYEQQDRGSISS